MAPALAEGHDDDREFDLDIRLDEVARHVAGNAALKPTDRACPDFTAQGTCTVQPS
jgi:hypothetical protein